MAKNKTEVCVFWTPRKDKKAPRGELIINTLEEKKNEAFLPTQQFTVGFYAHES